MKELSIEEKAKAYDEALKVLHKYDGANIMFSQDLKEEMFPELKESDDERIRKALIEGFKVMKAGSYGECTFSNYNIPVIDIITWLEKQGEHNSFSWTEDDEAKVKAMCEEGNLKPSERKWLNNLRYRVTENKAVPKFRKGEWLVENEPNNYARFIQILEVVNAYGKERYKISRDLHNDEDVVEYRFIENNYHSFTIQDAKDGDVLVSNDAFFIVLFKRLSYFKDDIDRFKSYCHYREGIFSPIEDPCWCCNAFHPATKEQRDTLMKAMANAGYTFDFEKKELKKIEQKPWSEEDKMQLDAAIHLVSSTGHIETANWLKSLRPQSTWRPSDEQLDSLYDVLNPCDGFNREMLESLYVQLKKLREEQI